MHNLVVDSSQELLENADNTNYGGDNEIPLTIINEIVPMSRLRSVRGSLIRPKFAQNPSTCARKKKRVSYNNSARVKMRRDNLFHMLRSDVHKEDAKNYGGSRNFL